MFSRLNFRMVLLVSRGIRRPIILTIEFDLHKVKLNHCAKYLSQMSVCSKIIVCTHKADQWLYPAGKMVIKKNLNGN